MEHNNTGGDKTNTSNEEENKHTDAEHKKENHEPFAPTNTKFGIIQREAERLGLPSHSQNKEFKHTFKPIRKDGEPEEGEEHTLKDKEVNAGVAKVSVALTESIIGVDAKVDADICSIDLKGRVDPKHIVDHLHHEVAPTDDKKGVETDTKLIGVSASAKAGFGLSGVGAVAGVTANAVSVGAGEVSANLGFGISTGAFVSPTQFTVHVLGTGVSVGEKTGVSIMGSGVSIDVGKAIEDIANKTVHHDPHAHIHPKVVHATEAIENHLGITKAKEVVNSELVEPSLHTATGLAHHIADEMAPLAQDLKSTLHLEQPKN
eukprot:TRINITY_DN402_c0_g1_i1.p2 TRINITY_DN402_c0_g1~~TRINITY_DN402_c0_g1_i1.p2  ORF type:complete len:318 (+),score=58.55 TRINITY_DN402_c0_g1_i1:1250-2203(+)